MASSPPADTLEALFLAVARRDGAERLLTVSDVAEALRVEPAWVYEHARELGALRLGGGRRAPIRFEARTIAARVRQLHEGVESAASQERPAASSAPRRRRARSAAPASHLLPVRGRLADDRVA